MTQLPARARSILDRHVIAHLATINPDGSPQLTAVWIERDGDAVRFSTAEGRVKLQNLRRDPRLAVSFNDPASPETAFTLIGRAVAIEQRGWDLIDRLARAYRGADGFPRIDGMVRVDVDVEVDRVIG